MIFRHRNKPNLVKNSFFFSISFYREFKLNGNEKCLSFIFVQNLIHESLELLWCNKSNEMNEIRVCHQINNYIFLKDAYYNSRLVARYDTYTIHIEIHISIQVKHKVTLELGWTIFLFRM